MRLLIAEDDAKLAGALSRGLRKEGYAVDVAATGDQALLSARVYEYDAVILDINCHSIVHDKTPNAHHGLCFLSDHDPDVLRRMILGAVINPCRAGTQRPVPVRHVGREVRGHDLRVISRA